MILAVLITLWMLAFAICFISFLLAFFVKLNVIRLSLAMRPKALMLVTFIIMTLLIYV